MEGNKVKPRALLVFGAPCSGKTTFAEKFAKRYKLTFYDFDSIREKSNYSQKDILYILELIARTGQNLIIEGCVGTYKERKEIIKILRKAGYGIKLVWIQTDLATIRMRLKARYRNTAEAKRIYEEAVNKLEAPSDLEFPIILSGKHTFDTQARHTLSGLAE